ncbi:putative serine carboxypeptidase-like 52 isoform X3 [Camellia sinensis]|uniref:putative serine carboxypeptidase-like 52 isoform X3 n=1 Tax=Camellia sinensis TaxID=4442 RepID=UPI001036C103|nr:putative serine carboxypeptidase-like 52 isoform X3 [Camellia sinensis]
MMYNYVLSDIWANDERVQKALHIRKGSIEKWVRCNKTLSYNEDLLTSIEYHRNLSHTDLRSLIYSGDHDMAIPYVGTQKWIDSLALPVDEDWRPWFVDGHVGGYTMKYVEKGFHLTFATVKGVGHTTPEYKPKECLPMLQRWLAYYNL